MHFAHRDWGALGRKGVTEPVLCSHWRSWSRRREKLGVPRGNNKIGETVRAGEPGLVEGQTRR